MTFVLWRSYNSTRKTISSCKKYNAICSFNDGYLRSFSDDKPSDNQELINTTILIENGYNVSELPLVIRKLKSLTDLESKEEHLKSSSDSSSYHLIQEEFKQCMDLRDVFSLITKCTKITPNIALGAIERIYDLEKNPLTLPFDTKSDQSIHFAKGAILDKLLKVVMKTEDTHTIINILQTNSSVIEPYKFKFCEELLLRVTDGKLGINHLCEFANFLKKNNTDSQYTTMLDKLWVGFIANERFINEANIVQIFNILSGLKSSKKTIIALLEHKLVELWPKLDNMSMQDVLGVIINEKYFSIQSFAVLSNWFYVNIHALDEDSMLDIITKFTRLNYTDDQVEGAVAKYMKLKGPKVNSYILIIGILNYCMQFQLRNEQILDECCKHYIKNIRHIPPSFLKSFIYPFGYLYYNPLNQVDLWKYSETKLLQTYNKINLSDLCSIILSYIYVGKHPLSLVTKIFHPENVTRINNSDLMQKLHLIDTSLSIECEDYSGPLLPKDQWLKPVEQDIRVQNIIEKIKDTVTGIIGEDRLSTAVLVPNYCSDENFLIDIMVHPAGLGSNTFNWKSKITRNENIALLINLPNHYCYKSDQLVGSQMMKKRHLQTLGFTVVSLKYSVLCQLYVSDKNELKKYLEAKMGNTTSTS